MHRWLYQRPFGPPAIPVVAERVARIQQLAYIPHVHRDNERVLLHVVARRVPRIQQLAYIPHVQRDIQRVLLQVVARRVARIRRRVLSSPPRPVQNLQELLDVKQAMRARLQVLRPRQDVAASSLQHGGRQTRQHSAPSRARSRARRPKRRPRRRQGRLPSS